MLPKDERPKESLCEWRLMQEKESKVNGFRDAREDECLYGRTLKKKRKKITDMETRNAIRGRVEFYVDCNG